MLRPGERLDDLQRNGFRIIQKTDGFRFGMDAVLLAAFAQVHMGEQVLDLGSGTGILPILLRARTSGSRFVGIEIDAEMAEMANRSVRLNHVEDSVEMRCGDLREADQFLQAASFDVVTSNPPYIALGHGRSGARKGIDAARHEISCTLEDVVRAAAFALHEQGRFYLVHRPYRLAEMMQVLHAARLEPKRLRLVYPMSDREPNLLLLEARKGGKPYLRVDPPLIVYETPGTYTREILEIYGREPQDTGGG